VVEDAALESFALKVTGPGATTASQLYVRTLVPLATTDKTVVSADDARTEGCAVSELIIGGAPGAVAVKLLPEDGTLLTARDEGENEKFVLAALRVNEPLESSSSR
jgi:hypothetical protein